MKFIKTYEGYFDINTGKIIDTGDFIIPSGGTPVQANEPEDTSSDTKLKFTKDSEPLTPPSWAKNPEGWASDELSKLLQTSHNTEYGNSGNVKFGSLTNTTVFANVYSSCFSTKNSNAIREVKERLEKLLTELKTKNPARIKDAVRVFFDNVGPKISDNNVSEWMKGKDKYSFGMDIVKFEQLCSVILA
jgi:hypothetical protein